MDKFRFDGQVAVVTGAGAGLGKAYATLLAGRGARVLVNDYNPTTSGAGGGDPAPAEATTAEIAAAGGTAEADAESVATPEGASAIIGHALGLWGRVDILINNAGFVAGRSIATVTDEQWRSDMAVAADGTFFMCRAVWNHMWERNYGRIVNTCSGSFFGMGTGVVAYPAAKAAAWAITKGLATYSTAAGRDVLVNCIMPTAYGRMTPGMGPEIAAMMEREFPPAKVAPLVALLAHADAPCNGEMFNAGGGFFARVFAGETHGYHASPGTRPSPEDVSEKFDEIMDTAGFVIPRKAMDPAVGMFQGPEWDSFLTFKKAG